MKTSKELLALTDLAGWRVSDGYWAELAHGSMANFPALFRESEAGEWEIFVCLDKAVLEGALRLLTSRRSRISRNLVLANEALGVSFDLAALNNRHDEGRESRPVRLLTEGNLQTHGDSKFFKWAPGLVSDDMSVTEFDEALRLALEKA